MPIGAVDASMTTQPQPNADASMTTQVEGVADVLTLGQVKIPSNTGEENPFVGETPVSKPSEDQDDNMETQKEVVVPQNQTESQSSP